MRGEDWKWEKKLGVCTGAGDYEKEDLNHSRYEPTGYDVLARLAESGYLSRESVLVDYGCGKGRVGFFLNYALGMKTIGIEYDECLYRVACGNLAGYAGRRDGRIEFVHANAEEYDPAEADCFYFFNPFSVKVLNSVLGRIFESYYMRPREMRLFFYYALDSYTACLMTEDRLRFEGEIDCRDLFPGANPQEKILVFCVDAG